MATRSIHNGRHWGKQYSGRIAKRVDDIVRSRKQNSWNQQQYKRAYDGMLKEARIKLKQGKIA